MKTTEGRHLTYRLRLPVDKTVRAKFGKLITSVHDSLLSNIRLWVLGVKTVALAQQLKHAIDSLNSVLCRQQSLAQQTNSSCLRDNHWNPLSEIKHV